MPSDEQMLTRLGHAVDRARYATNTLAAAEKLARKGSHALAIAQLHTAINVLAAATQSASAACENLMEEINAL